MPQTDGDLQVLARPTRRILWRHALLAQAGGAAPTAPHGGRLRDAPDGEPLLTSERGGKGILRLAELNDGDFIEVLGAIAEAAQAGQIEKLAIERVDGEAVIGSGLEPAMIEAGFRRQPAQARRMRMEGDSVLRLARRLGRAPRWKQGLVRTPGQRRPDGLPAAELDGRVLERAECRGKHLLLHFDGGVALHAHNGHAR